MRNKRSHQYAILARLIELGFAVRFSEHFQGDAKAFFAAAVKHGLEGIVSKRALSCYRSDPSRNWLTTNIGSPMIRDRQE